MDYAQIRGFNYQPSYGRNGLELWWNFNAETIRTELGRGKDYFPGMNAIRLWLSWDAFTYGHEADRKQFCANFDTALTLADNCGLQVMPVLFNRWHNLHLDYGGIYIDHFVRGLAGAGDRFNESCIAYVDAVVGPHAQDERILAWDLCNEPFSYSSMPEEMIAEIEQAEYAWLASLYARCKELDARAPITVGVCGRSHMRRVDPISDVLSIHPYWKHGEDTARFEVNLDDCLGFARRVGKLILATETCWGHLDDAKRVEIIRYTLGELKKRKIGWLVYLLHHSLIADAHRPEYGPVGAPYNLAFIEADGGLRPGHEVFNDY